MKTFGCAFEEFWQIGFDPINIIFNIRTFKLNLLAKII
jgi:hypothetical protein